MRARFLTPLVEDLKAIGLNPTQFESLNAEEPIDEVKAVKLKRSTAGQRTKWRKANKKRRSSLKKYRKKASTQKRMKKLARLHARKPSGAGRRKRFSLEHRSIDPADLLSEGRTTAENLSEGTLKDKVTAFAELSLAAEALYNNLDEISEEFECEDLEESKEAIEALVKGTADIADALRRGLALEGADLSEGYMEGLETLIEHMEVYDELAEEAEECEACSCNSDDEEDDEEDSEDDEEDDAEDDEDMEESSKKAKRK